MPLPRWRYKARPRGDASVFRSHTHTDLSNTQTRPPPSTQTTQPHHTMDSFINKAKDFAGSGEYAQLGAGAGCPGSSHSWSSLLLTEQGKDLLGKVSGGNQGSGNQQGGVSLSEGVCAPMSMFADHAWLIRTRTALVTRAMTPTARATRAAAATTTTRSDLAAVSLATTRTDREATRAVTRTALVVASRATTTRTAAADVLAVAA